MTFIKTTQTPATAENKKWLRIRVRLFTNLQLRIRSEKTQNPDAVDSASVAISASKVIALHHCYEPFD